MKYAWAAIVALALLSAAAQGHLCNNIYRTPDRLVVKPERARLLVDRTEQFRVFVKNNYPTKLDNVRLSARIAEPGFTVTVTPQAIARMLPGEKATFLVRVEVSPGAKGRKGKLEIGISANQVGFRPAGEASIAELRNVLRDSNPSPKVLACESLARRGDRVGINWLAEAIRGGDRNLVSRALRAVGKSGNRRLARLALSRLGDRDGLIRGNAALALGLLGAERPRVKQLCADRDEFVRTCARAALAIMGDTSQLAALRQALGSGNQWARAAAAWGLGYHRDLSAVDVLDRLFEVGNAELKVMAGDALVSIAAKYADLRQVGEAAPAPQGPQAAAPQGPRRAPPTTRAPAPPGEPSLATKCAYALAYLCFALGAMVLVYLAYQKWVVRGRRR